MIFAAGRGERLKPLTNFLPKPLVNVNGRPLLSYVLEVLPEHISEIYIVIGYKGEMIRKYVGEYYHGRKVNFFEQKELNGTGGAFELVRDLIDEQVLILNADDIYDQGDILRLVGHRDMAILGYKEFGSCEYAMKVENGQFRGFVSMADGDFVRNAGAYLVNELVKDLKMVEIPVRGGVELSLPHALAEICGEYVVDIVLAKSWFPVGNVEQLKIVEDFNKG